MGASRRIGFVAAAAFLAAAAGACSNSDGGGGATGGSGGGGGGSGGTGGNEPSCDASMDWTPRVFDGPAFHVAPTGESLGSGTEADPWTDLQHAIDQAPDGARLLLAPGLYAASPTPYTDPSCGNCAPDDQHPVPATRGFLVAGKSLQLVGAGQLETALETRAGYGVLIEDACEVQLIGLTVAGGVRDPDGQAADGAVVVRRSRVVLDDVGLRDNTGLLPENGYPGIAGLMLRQGSDALVTGATIENNSWDGVTVFDDGKLRMYGSKVSRGNGVGVGVTWSGRALLVNNDISRYWKGIGSFVDAQVEARNNTVHHNVGWGAWVTGRARLDLINNTVAYNDVLGVSLSGDEVTGTFANNVVAYNGRWVVRSYAADAFGGRFGIRGATPAEGSVFEPRYNHLHLNQLYHWVGADGAPVDPTTPGTNELADPAFVSEDELVPGPGSALIDAGDPALRDPDGSRSDVGATGGPFAGRTGP